MVSLVARSLEVALFAMAYRISLSSGFGSLEGNFEGSIADYLYLSYAALTTVGFWGHRAHRAGSFACQNGSANGIRFNHLDRVIPIS